MGKKTLWASALALICMFAFFEITNVDVLIQQRLYNPALKSWFLQDHDSFYRNIFYTGIKKPIYVIGVGCLMASLISWRKNIWNDYRKGFIIVALTLIILPLSIAVGGKNLSNVQCPAELDLFNGSIPYVKHFEAYPPNPNSPDGKWPKGRCWPAGHASGGFALLSLVCLFRKKSHKISAFIFAMSMGWIMGVYQMLRGAHFLSHHLTTMFLALILVSFLNLYIKDFNHASSEVKE